MKLPTLAIAAFMGGAIGLSSPSADAANSSWEQYLRGTKLFYSFSASYNSSFIELYLCHNGQFVEFRVRGTEYNYVRNRRSGSYQIVDNEFHYTFDSGEYYVGYFAPGAASDQILLDGNRWFIDGAAGC